MEMNIAQDFIVNSKKGEHNIIRFEVYILLVLYSIFIIIFEMEKRRIILSMKALQLLRSTT